MKKLVLLLVVSLAIALSSSLAWSAAEEGGEEAPVKKERPAAQEITATGVFETQLDDEGAVKGIALKVDEKTTYRVTKTPQVLKMVEEFKGKTVKVTGALRGKNLMVKTCEAVVVEGDVETAPEVEEAPADDAAVTE